MKTRVMAFVAHYLEKGGKDHMPFLTSVSTENRIKTKIS